MRAVAIGLLVAASALCACGKYGAPVRGGAEAAAAGEAASDDAGAPVPNAWEAPEETAP